MQLTRLIAILFVSFVLVTCKEDDEPQLPACKLITFEGPTVKFTYEYEGDVLKSRTATWVVGGGVLKKVSYEYDDAGNLTSLSAPGEVGMLTYTNGQITRIESMTSTSFSQEEYEYSGERLVKVQYYEASGFNKTDYTTLEYEGSNVIIAKTYRANGTLRKTEEFKHGDKYSPFLALPEAYIKLLRLEDFAVGNNLTSYKNSDGVEINYEAEFNTYGFATKLISTFSDGDMDTRLFTYNCPD